MSEKESDKLPEDPEGPDGSAKRRRTNSSDGGSAAGASWMTSASPPRFTSFEELMTAAKGLDNMALAHEISINDQFRLEKPQVANDSLEKVVEDVMHKAFWDVLRAQLDSTPPNHDYAIKLLEEVKKELKSLLLPQHTRLSHEIDEHLDIQLARQQSSSGGLDFKAYANYIIGVMEGLCAPVRDENIRQLRSEENIIETFKLVFETLSLMKLDMANFTISQFRPVIAARSVEYERQQFQKYLDATPDGLRSTELWLRKTVDRESQQRNSEPLSVVKILSAAYWDLLEADWSDAEYPETLLVDRTRLDELAGKFFSIIMTAAAVLITCSCGGANVADSESFKSGLKAKLMILLQDCRPADVSTRLEMVVERVLHEYEVMAKQFDWPQWTEAKVAEMRAQLMQLADPSQSVRHLVRTRVRQFVVELLSSQPSQVRMPPGLGLVADDIKEATGRFCRIASHNRAVFIDVYKPIIDRLVAAVSP